MFKIVLTLLTIIIVSSACVSKKSFDALQSEKNELSEKLDILQAEFMASEKAMHAEMTLLKNSNSNLTSEKAALDADFAKVKGDLESKLNEVQSSVDDKQRQLDAMRGEINAAFADVEQAVSSSNARINEIENFLYLDLDDEINFLSGSNNIDPNDKETLLMLAEMLQKNPSVAMIVEGHTDSRGISSEKFEDNWDLSVSRATSVVRQLISLGVNPEQLIASGRGEYMPTESNESASGRNKNRRTEVIVVPNIGKLYRVSKR